MAWFNSIGGAAVALIIANLLIDCVAFSGGGYQKSSRVAKVSYNPHLQHQVISTATQLQSSLSDNNNNDILDKITSELKEISECTSLAYSYISKPNQDVSVEDVVLASDAVDNEAKKKSTDDITAQLYMNQYLSLRQKTHEFGRYHLLVKLLSSDYDAYIKTAEFLSPSRINRGDLPNVQDVAYVETSASTGDETTRTTTSSTTVTGDDGEQLVADCELQDLSYNDSPLDKLLLSIFRKLVTENTGGVTSDIPGIKGLLAQGRQYMTQELPEGVSYSDHTKAQHTMVKNTLAGLMTPVLPPFYRIFMSGIVPKLGTDYDGKQIGPWFYAPWLTSIVTPTFFGFLGKRLKVFVHVCALVHIIETNTTYLLQQLVHPSQIVDQMVNVADLL